MNNNINHLREIYAQIINDHTEIIQKMATTLEESFIYQNDTNIYNKFYDICESNSLLSDKIGAINFNKSTTFNHIIDDKDELYNRLHQFNSYILEVCDKIKTATQSAYEEYCTEFKKYQDDYLYCVDIINAGFELCDNCTDELRILNGERASYIGNEIVPDTLLSEIEEYENIRAKGYNALVTNVSRIRKDCNELKRILEIALKKGTAAQ